MPDPHYFISYSRADGEAIAVRLADQLAEGSPRLDVWLDRRRLQPGIDWDEQLVAALRSCDGLLFVMTPGSVNPKSECKREWTRALKYKKPIIPLLFDPEAELPYRLEPREYVDFTHGFEAGLDRLRAHVRWRATPEGVLHALRERREDARRDLARGDPVEVPRIRNEIEQLERQISEQEHIATDPTGAQQRADESIQSAIVLQRERHGETASKTRFINPPPLAAPSWFQDRHIETKIIGEFLRDEAVRMITVVGRDGVGKTAMACRLLKALEQGRLPDDLGTLQVEGIVYLSGTSAHSLSFAHLFRSLCQLLPQEVAARLDQLYQDPQQDTQAQMRALLDAFTNGPVVVLLDNLDVVIDPQSLSVEDRQLDDALRAVLKAPQHPVKFIVTTRLAPKQLLLTEPGRQQRLDFDQGIPQPFAQSILRELDRDGRLGLKAAPDALLAEACARTQGYPRALEALAGILSADRDASLQDILADTSWALPENVVEALVGEAFSRLDAVARQAMQALSVYAAPVPAVAIDYLLQPYRIGVNSAPDLARLVNMHLARRDAGRYFLHPIDRDYAARSIPQGVPDDRDVRNPPPFTRFALLHRAAGYFRETRLPRESWKSLDDLEPCLAEFALLCSGESFDEAAQVLLEISAFLETWGHYRLLVSLHQRLRGRLADPALELSSLLTLAWSGYRMGEQQNALPLFSEALALARGIKDRAAETSIALGLGHCCRAIGDCTAAITHYEQVQTMAHEMAEPGIEAAALGSLATIMHDLGKMSQAFDYGHRALDLARSVGDRQSECMYLFNFGCAFHRFGEIRDARRCYDGARQIADEIGYGLIRAASRIGLGDLLNYERRWAEAVSLFDEVIQLADDMQFAQAQIEARLSLGQALLGLDALERADAVLAEAIQYSFLPDAPMAYALHGIAALRLGNAFRARGSFTAAAARADELLERSGAMWNAQYAKALALAGLALCMDAGLAAAAAALFREASGGNAAPGIVKSVRDDLDSLMKADAIGLLKPVWAALDAEDRTRPAAGGLTPLENCRA